MSDLNVEVRERVAQVTLNRPETGNALTGQMLWEMDKVLGDLETDPSVKAIVLVGAGDDFCVGMDESEITGAEGFRGSLAFQEEWARRMQFIFNLHKPTIAAIQGRAFGAGLDLMLVCDLAVAAEDARFAVQGVAKGNVASFALGQWYIGIKPTQRLVLLGEELSGREAETVRLVNRATPKSQLMAWASRYARALAIPPGDGMALAKEALNGVMAARGAPQGWHYAALLRAGFQADRDNMHSLASPGEPADTGVGREPAGTL